MKKKCNHSWVNFEGCILCGKSWKKLNKERIYLRFKKPPLLQDIKK